MPIDSYKTCHLARVPAHAIVSRKDPKLADLIYNTLTTVRVHNTIISVGTLASLKTFMMTRDIKRITSTVGLTFGCFSLFVCL